MERRMLLQLIGAGVMAEKVEAAQHHLLTLAQTSAAYKLQFFSSAQKELLDQLAEMIIPADERSPGAREAQVGLFIDLMVAHSDSGVQQEWVDGLRAVDADAQRRFRTSFLECSHAQQDEIMAAMATEEILPTTPLGRFFALLRSRTLDGYYTSATGIHQELRYKGNHPQERFVGCTHPEHAA